MCNGIAVLVYPKDGQLKGLCTGATSHDELCKLDKGLRYGKIEPYRFELLYPCNLRYDRSSDIHDGIGIAKEQPAQEIWEIAFKIAKPFFMKHSLKQLQFANFRSANLADVNLKGADLRGANLADVNLKGADLRGANLADVNLKGADLRDANLADANLKGADLRDANLADANLIDTNLVDADLRGTNLSWANGTKTWIQ